MKRDSLRRVPLQTRSRERLERILDAAEQELARSGYEAATMQAIADRAETSIGSVYQFFPNKKVLFDAIWERYLARVRALFEGFLAGADPALGWQGLLDRAIDTFRDFNKNAPGFRVIWGQGNLSPELISAGAQLNREMAERIEVVLALFVKGLTKKRRAIVATMVVETISMVLFVAGRREEPMATQIVEESKVLLRRYIEGYVR